MTGKDMLEKSGMTPESSHVIVTVTLDVETLVWGEDCTIGQAVKQAVDSAKIKIRNLIKDDLEVRLVEASFARVITSARKGGAS